jgi:raffinose/stachyose/melibiose transport system substrate-binding protein
MRHRPLRRGRTLLTGAAATLTLSLSALAVAPAAAQDGPQTSGWETLGDVTLRISGEGTSEPALTTLAQQFMEQYPNVTIETEFKDFNSFMATVLTIADAPDAPDIIFGNQGYTVDGPLVEAGLILPLDPYYEAYGWNDWYSDGTKAQFRFSEDGSDFGAGPLWGIAESADFVGVYYNIDKLAALGLEPPTTFAELEAALAAAKAAGELPIKLGNQQGWPATHALGIAQGAFWAAPSARGWVFGEEGADFASAENLQAVQAFKAWVDNGYINEDVNALDYDPAWQQFAQGDGVFLPAGNWLADDLRDTMGEDKVGFIAPPTGASGEVVAVAALSLPLHISSRSANPDLAAGFINFALNPDKGQVYYDNGRVPASAGSVGTPGDAITQQQSEVWTRISEDDGLIYYQDWASDTMYDTLTGTLQELIGSRTTPEDFVATIQEDWATFQGSR